ncbi:MAG: hypothetical protein RI947_963 [Candidatus Parcubacteria bacterium]|jgi:uncharacterized protein YkwD
MLQDYMGFFVQHANWVDLAFVLILVYFIWMSSGFIETLLETIGFLLSLVLAYDLYPQVGRLISQYFSVPAGLAQAGGFFLIWTFSEAIVLGIITYGIRKLLTPFSEHRINKLFAFIPGIIQAFAICLLFIAVIFALPVKGWIKEDILNSITGPSFVNLSQSAELRVKNVFGKAVEESLNFMTIKPTSGETLDLGFKVDPSKHRPDAESESIMLDKVNEERAKRGIHTLQPDTALRGVARDYASQMLANGFFSHVSVFDGSTSAERATKAGIEYMIIGENLAFAPDVYIAHQGLMNSPGHKRNILSLDYHSVGIGIIDGGVYGKMFVQVFKD